jgi:hypothetical protein
MFVVVAAASAIAACSLIKSDTGESCGKNASTEHCEGGSICSADSDCSRAQNACEDRDGNTTCDSPPKCDVSAGQELICRKICKDHSDCPKGFGCHTVWLAKKKSCQPDEDSD